MSTVNSANCWAAYAFPRALSSFLVLFFFVKKRIFFLFYFIYITGPLIRIHDVETQNNLRIHECRGYAYDIRHHKSHIPRKSKFSGILTIITFDYFSSFLARLARVFCLTNTFFAKNTPKITNSPRCSSIVRNITQIEWFPTQHHGVNVKINNVRTY